MIVTKYLGNFGRAAVLTTAGFITLANASAQEVDLRPIETQVAKNETPLEEKVRLLEQQITNQQKEIALNRSEIESLKTDKVAKSIPLIVYASVIAYFLLKHQILTKTVNSKLTDVNNELERLAQSTARAVREAIDESNNSKNDPFGIMDSISSSINGVRLTTMFHSVLSQLDDDFREAIGSGDFGGAGGIKNTEQLHILLAHESELFNDYSTYTDDEKRDLPIISFGQVMTRPNEDHDDGDLPGSEAQQINAILIPSDFQADKNLYVTLIAREFSRVIHMPKDGYKTLAESQTTALEKEIELIENLVLLLTQINSGMEFDDLVASFPINTEKLTPKNFESFKEFVQLLELDPEILKKILDQHSKELDSWKAIQRKVRD